MKIKQALQKAFNASPSGNASKTALLVIDVQEGYCAPKYRKHVEQDAVARRIASIAPAFRKAGIPIYAVYYDEHYLGGFHRFKPANDDIVVPKNKDSAFEGSNMEELLKKNGHKNLLICGVYESLCVKKTAEDALKRGFKVTVLKDLTADWEAGERDGYYEHPAPPAGETFAELRKAGASIETSSTVLQKLTKNAPKPAASPKIS